MSLEKDRWELGIPTEIYKNKTDYYPLSQQEISDLKIGDLISLIIVSIAQDETDDPVRSVHHDRLWAKIEKILDQGYIGILKSESDYPLTVKNADNLNTITLTKGLSIFFEAKNIFSIRKRKV